ncbi:MAG: polyprenyl synthetase family protein [Nitrososphaeria archaeon]
MAFEVNPLSLQNEMKFLSSRVDEYMEAYFDREPKRLYDASYYLIKQGGKRQRPFILVNSGLMFGGSLDSMLPAAAAVEFLHNFTLVHDDIMDNDEERRGAPTVHLKYGVPMAILAGDLLFAKSFESALRLVREAYSGEKVLRISDALVRAAVEVCEGQALDLLTAVSKEFPSKMEYYHLIELKTSSLFKACAVIGSVLGGADEDSIMKMREFGRLYGLCFQLVDDVLGVSGDRSVTGKPVGNDIREGKKTLVMRYVLENVGEDDRRRLLSMLGDGSATSEQINYALSLIAKSGATDMVRAEAKSISDEAVAILQSFPSSKARDMLINLTFEASTRSK